MSNLLSSALNTNYREVEVVKSIPAIQKNDLQEIKKNDFLKKQTQNRNTVLLAFGGLAVLGVASMLISDSKKAKKIAEEAKELADESQILYGYVEPIKENSQKILDAATEFVGQTVKRIKQGCASNEFVLNENTLTKISCLTEQGQGFIATCTKKADDILIDSIEWHKVDDITDLIHCDSNNVVTRVFSNLKKHGNLFDSFSSIHLFENSKLKMATFDVIKEEGNYKAPNIFKFEEDECVKIGKNCVFDSSGSNGTIEKFFLFKDGVISKCGQNMKKTAKDKDYTVDSLFSYQDGIFSNYEDFLSDRVSFWSEQLDMLLMTFFSVFDDIF